MSASPAEVEARTFGQLLRRLRVDAGLSQARLAARVHFSTPYIANIEQGRRRPTARVAAALDHALGTDPLLVRAAGVPVAGSDDACPMCGRRG